MIVAYRVDRRLFAVGDRIEPTGEYATVITQPGRELEEALEARRPSKKPRRVGALFLFSDLESAKEFWSKMADGKLYRVEIAPDAVLHSGDMSWTDYALANRENPAEVTNAVDAYWSGAAGPKGHTELLVRHAVVVEVLSTNDATRKLEFRKRHAPWSLDP